MQKLRELLLHPLVMRAFRTYLHVLSGLLTAKGFGVDQGVLPKDFFDALLFCAQISLAPAVMSVIHNLSELMSGLETHKMRG